MPQTAEGSISTATVKKREGYSPPAQALSDRESMGSPPGAPYFSDVRGSAYFIDAPHESEPGHTYRLARSLVERTDVATSVRYEPFGDTARAPIPNKVLDSLDSLSGCAVRLCIVLMRDAYRWQGDRWRCSPRFLTRSDMRSVGMSAQSLRNAAAQLEEKGWIEIRQRGQSHAYRWRLKAPRESFTFLPLDLLHEHYRLSHSGLKLVLAVYRKTWGWTQKDAGTTKHRASARLSVSDLEDATGLSPSTIRSAAEEVIHNSALRRDRPHEGTAYFWAADPSFFEGRRTKSKGGTTSRKNLDIQSRAPARARERRSERGTCRSDGEGRGSERRATQLSDAERRHVRDLTSEPFEMPFPVAARLVNRASLEVVAQTRGAFQARREDIQNPGGWMRAALENLWYGPEERISPPDVQQFSGENWLKGAFEAFQGGSQKSRGGAEPRNDGGGSVGLSHSQMCEVIDTLSQPPGGWECIEREGRPNRFVPTSRLANWCWTYADQLGDQEARDAAHRLVEIRKDHEGRDEIP